MTKNEGVSRGDRLFVTRDLPRWLPVELAVVDATWTFDNNDDLYNLVLVQNKVGYRTVLG